MYSQTDIISSCKKTYQFKTQCKDDVVISESFWGTL